MGDIRRIEKYRIKVEVSEKKEIEREIVKKKENDKLLGKWNDNLENREEIEEEKVF